MKIEMMLEFPLKESFKGNNIMDFFPAAANPAIMDGNILVFIWIKGTR